MTDAARIVELVGPPGSGKTTLARLLRERSDRVLIAETPYFRRVRSVPFFATNLLLSLPTLLELQARSNSGGFGSRDIALMVILRGWPRDLRRRSQDGTTVVLEEGCVSYLAKLRRSGSDASSSESARRWRQSTYELWAETLDAMVQLETPIPILLGRIRARDMQYEVGDMPDEHALDYLASIRAAQDDVVAGLVARTRRSKLFCLDTVDRSPEQLCDEVMIATGLAYGRGPGITG
jgi:hypothetical protein